MGAWKRILPALGYGMLTLLLVFLIAVGLIAAGLLLGSRLGAPGEFQVNTPFFEGKQVMVIVPHQDDELNLAGGILEQYTRAGSNVTIVYATNGDYNGLAELRSREALEVAASVGVPAENVIYLGYGDQWEHQEQNGILCKHLYFSRDPEALWTSHYGATGTYGTAYIDCYARSDYTRKNFLADLTSVILERRPDVIYCVDYDAHHDHMALDLFFEEAMGRILVREPDYRPNVYKGFCYGTAWHAEADFFGSQNLRSAQFPAWEHWDRLGIGYDWEERIRLPLDRENLSRMLSDTQVYQSLRLFWSQEGYSFAEKVLNGDKVFWQRRTDSLLYRAAFYAGQEQVFVWNDFKLKDSVDFSALVNTGVRYADRIDVVLEEPAAMDAVWLYDHPTAEDNILAGYLLFEDGTRVDFGPLNPGGSATRIVFSERTVERFSVCFTDTQGETPGVTEIEAYLGDGIGKAGPQLLMAADGAADFAYDYWIPQGDTAEFDLYSYPAGTAGWEDVSISLEGDGECTWSLENGRLRIHCPKGRETAVTIAAENGVSTTFTVSNPSALLRQGTLLLQKLDRQVIYTREDLITWLAEQSAE